MAATHVDIASRQPLPPRIGAHARRRCWRCVALAVAARRRARAGRRSAGSRRSHRRRRRRTSSWRRRTAPTNGSPVGLNYPVASGDNLWVAGEGRAEVDFGGGQFRLAGDTNVHVSRLDDRDFALFVAQGRVDRARARARAGRRRAHRHAEHAGRADAARACTGSTCRRSPGDARSSCAKARPRASRGRPAAGAAGPDAPRWSATDDVQADVRNGTRHRRLRHVEREPRPLLRAQPHRARTCRAQMVGYADLDAVRRVADVPGLRRRLVPVGGRRRLGAVSRRLLDRRCPAGARRGSTTRRGATRRSTTVAGRTSAAAGAGVPGRYVARPVWAPALVAWYGGSGWRGRAAAGPVYGWVPLGWREPYMPVVAQLLERAAGTTTTGRTR